MRDHILLGPTYGNGLDIADDLSGFVSNPMQYAESSKIALFSIADYTWNMKHYDWKASWRRAIIDLLPSDSIALLTFASYNEDLGPNGHGFRRDESRQLEALEKRIKAVADGEVDREAVQELSQTCFELGTACDLLLNNTENPLLINELRPWLVQGKLIAQYGGVVCKAARYVNQITAVDAATYNPDDLYTFYSLYRQAQSLRKQMYENEVDKHQLHTYQTGTKLATRRLMPMLDRLMSRVCRNHGYEPISAYTPFSIESTVEQLRALPISTYGAEVKVTPSNEVIKWPAGAQFTIVGDRPFTLTGMDFNLGVNEIAGKFRLDCLLEDGTWKTVSILHYKPTDPVIHTGNELSGLTVKAFRLTNISGADVECYFRHFKFNKQ